MLESSDIITVSDKPKVRASKGLYSNLWPEKYLFCSSKVSSKEKNLVKLILAILSPESFRSIVPEYLTISKAGELSESIRDP
ncbi:hypothetical protein ES708_33889 [subsurface metagenome]